MKYLLVNKIRGWSEAVKRYWYIFAGLAVFVLITWGFFENALLSCRSFPSAYPIAILAWCLYMSTFQKKPIVLINPASIAHLRLTRTFSLVFGIKVGAALLVLAVALSLLLLVLYPSWNHVLFFGSYLLVVLSYLLFWRRYNQASGVAPCFLIWSINGILFLLFPAAGLAISGATIAFLASRPFAINWERFMGDMKLAYRASAAICRGDIVEINAMSTENAEKVSYRNGLDGRFARCPLLAKALVVDGARANGITVTIAFILLVVAAIVSHSGVLGDSSGLFFVLLFSLSVNMIVQESMRSLKSMILKRKQGLYLPCSDIKLTRAYMALPLCYVVFGVVFPCSPMGSVL
ncbi:hypothetical protein C1879_07395 [Paraeggerthella hongkongensis]|uniref:hypothetical protein n=1 Tax=Paraeggerthella sp. TaxID=2897350 RepID=UPI000DF8486B|nr:hypothetical protein C1879_07395 [Paraeggerthella hongkongensis]